MGEMRTAKTARRFGRRYPWSDWEGRSALSLLTLRRGVDFDCEPSSIAVMARVRFGPRSRSILVRGDSVLIGPWVERKRLDDIVNAATSPTS